ncbi:LysR family transcriptional regulator [Oceanobacillus piezotolerans]|uniref:LysR family transcriptional regulator n=1 Tax=Oceanobacillus piezotolerans TaxID=2448030 RepID=A0A498D7S2_9BACI|nr:LysR family transcriptional regulator [Oceanobacillus piezotolerans]RLL44897.1 LysR family transcriptional regulator [Oceanobacillus piezotolerans]
MNIESLSIFCLVVEEGSISQAARLKELSQPAVTRQIHQMENTYGTLLFDRTNGKLYLTDAGEALYPIAKEIVRGFQFSKEAIQQVIGKNEQKLSVGASLTIGEYLLPIALGNFKKKHPNINLSLQILNTAHILDMLENNVIDVAMVEGVVENKAFEIQKFADDELILICDKEHPWNERESIEIQEITKEHLIWRESTSGTRMIVEKALREFIQLDEIRGYMELGSTQAIKSAVEAGLGISILPRITVKKELEQGDLREVKVSNFQLNRDLWLVQKSERFNKKSTETFVKYILSLSQI